MLAGPGAAAAFSMSAMSRASCSRSPGDNGFSLAALRRLDAAKIDQDLLAGGVVRRERAENLLGHEPHQRVAGSKS